MVLHEHLNIRIQGYFSRGGGGYSVDDSLSSWQAPPPPANKEYTKTTRTLSRWKEGSACPSQNAYKQHTHKTLLNWKEGVGGGGGVSPSRRRECV